MMASEKRKVSFGNGNNLLDASFSSYLNGNGTEESFVLKLTQSNHQNLNSLVPKTPPQQHAYIAKKKVEDGEIGIFGAEKYFKGAIDMEEIPRIPNKPNSMNHQELKDDPMIPKAQSATPSIQSKSSWNSRSGLLHTAAGTRSSRERSGERNKGNTTVKSLFASLGCHCNDKNSVKITEQRVHGKEIAKPPEKAGDLAQKTVSLSSRWAEEDVHGKNMKREECFSFPVLNSKAVKMEVQEEDTTRNSLVVFGSHIMEKGKKSFSLERKLTMLNWDGVTPRVENLDILKNGKNDDAESDTSSDLFEIESFSTNGNSFLGRQVSTGRDNPLKNGYAPSEASVEWSVVTASVADFSTASDYEEISATTKNYSNTNRNTRIDMEKRGPGILSGCKSLKSVRVAGDKNFPSVRERRRVDFVKPIAKFQAETRSVQHVFDAHTLTRSHSPRASQHLYIQ